MHHSTWPHLFPEYIIHHGCLCPRPSYILGILQLQNMNGVLGLGSNTMRLSCGGEIFTNEMNFGWTMPQMQEQSQQQEKKFPTAILFQGWHNSYFSAVENTHGKIWNHFGQIKHCREWDIYEVWYTLNNKYLQTDGQNWIQYPYFITAYTYLKQIKGSTWSKFLSIRYLANQWMLLSATILHSKAILGRGQPGIMRWILVWTVTQV